jgi:hypothetical protein
MKKIEIELNDVDYDLLKEIARDKEMLVSELLTKFIHEDIGVESGKNMGRQEYRTMIEEKMSLLRLKKNWMFSRQMVKDMVVTMPDTEDY